MAITNLKELLVHELKDLHNAETQVEGAFKRWSDAATSDQLTDAFNEHVETTRTHRERIESIAEDIGFDPSGERCRGVEGLIREGDEFLQQVESGATRDAGLVAMANRIEHYGVAGYGTARTYALQLGFDDAAETLQKTLDEETDLDQRITELAEGVLNVAAAEEPLVA